MTAVQLTVTPTFVNVGYTYNYALHLGYFYSTASRLHSDVGDDDDDHGDDVQKNIIIIIILYFAPTAI